LDLENFLYLFNHSAAICHHNIMSATLKSTGSGSIWVKILECYPWNRSVILGSAVLTNREIILEEFQLMWSRYFNVTDRRTTCRSNRRNRVSVGISAICCKSVRLLSSFFLVFAVFDVSLRC